MDQMQLMQCLFVWYCITFFTICKQFRFLCFNIHTIENNPFEQFQTNTETTNPTQSSLQCTPAQKHTLRHCLLLNGTDFQAAAAQTRCFASAKKAPTSPCSRLPSTLPNQLWDALTHTLLQHRSGILLILEKPFTFRRITD